MTQLLGRGRGISLMTLVFVSSLFVHSFASPTQTQGDGDGFTLTILHTNDVHARIDETNAHGSLCHETDTVCYGGVARRATAVSQIRQQHENVILLDAGDQYQGSAWFYVHKGNATVHFMNKLGYNAMTLGNHEFDNKISGLIPFMMSVSFPIICSNIDASEEPEMMNLFNKSTILELGGERIGVVGYITAEASILSSTGKLRFLDEITSVQAEVDRLTSLGINKIIGLGHAGIDVDRRIAEAVHGLDLIVGGHTHTFLYTGKAPSSDTPEDVYPIVVNKSNGDSVLIVHAYALGKYLGFLQVTFDINGTATNWTGNPILLDNTVAKDAEFLREVEIWKIPIESMYTEVVGFTVNDLDGERVSCRLKECTLGNLMTDAMIERFQQSGASLRNVNIALLNGGGIRSTIDQGNVTVVDVTDAFPFGNTVDVVELLGSDLRRVLEFSVEDYNLLVPHGKFLQVAGLRLTYNVSQPNGERVEEVWVKTSENSYVPLDDLKLYNITTLSFLIGGGDGYSMIKESMKRSFNLGIVDSDVLIDYFKLYSPVDVRLEGRIRFTPGTPPVDVSTTRSSVNSTETLTVHFNRFWFIEAVVLMYCLANMFAGRFY